MELRDTNLHYTARSHLHEPVMWLAALRLASAPQPERQPPPERQPALPALRLSDSAESTCNSQKSFLTCEPWEEICLGAFTEGAPGRAKMSAAGKLQQQRQVPHKQELGQAASRRRRRFVTESKQPCEQNGLGVKLPKVLAAGCPVVKRICKKWCCKRLKLH